LGYYNDPEGADLRTLREGLRIVRSIAQQEPLASNISKASYFDDLYRVPCFIMHLFHYALQNSSAYKEQEEGVERERGRGREGEVEGEGDGEGEGDREKGMKRQRGKGGY
jgi:hypothetical protein